MPMTSVFPGCAHEGACGHAEVTHCANRVPARWCSCDPLRRAEADRDRYREAAMSAACRARIAGGSPCTREGCPDRHGYCDAVIEEVG